MKHLPVMATFIACSWSPAISCGPNVWSSSPKPTPSAVCLHHRDCWREVGISVQQPFVSRTPSAFPWLVKSQCNSLLSPARLQLFHGWWKVKSVATVL